VVFDKIPEERREDYLRELLDYVVERNGLASIPKADLEACFVYLYKKHAEPDIDLYSLSRLFRVKESKLKGLLELFHLKFGGGEGRTDNEVILSILSATRFSIESFERVQISFHFRQIEFFALLQHFFRRENSYIRYDRSAELAAVNQNALYAVLDRIWTEEDPAAGRPGSGREQVRTIIGNIGRSLDSEMRNELRKKPGSAFFKNLKNAGTLAGIGKTVLDIYRAGEFQLNI
jgi:hypothetical protein